MAKCRRCDKFGLFMPVNKIGLCPTCEREYFFISRHSEIFIESSEIAGKTENLHTRLSRYDLALQKLYIIRDFGNDNYDLFWETTKTNHIDDMIELFSDLTNNVRDIYITIEEIISDFIRNNVSVSKRLIVDFLKSEEDKSGRKLNFDIPKSVSSILEEMEFQGKIRKEKIKNRYEYFLTDAAVG